MTILGNDVLRKEAWNKVDGAAKYNIDENVKNVLYAKMLTSIHAHAGVSVDVTDALKVEGVKSILTARTATCCSEISLVTDLLWQRTR